MLNVNKLPALDLEVGAPGSSKHNPTAVGTIMIDHVGVILGILF